VTGSRRGKGERLDRATRKSPAAAGGDAMGVLLLVEH